jgi:hypothetical protein
MRSRCMGLRSHPCPVNKGSLVFAAYQETMIQHILSVFIVVTKFYDNYFSILDVLVFKSYNNVLRQTCSLPPIVYCMWK